jgi:hypothetical protein
VIDVVRQDPPRSTAIRRSSVSGVVQDWLQERDLRGADAPTATFVVYCAT